MKFLLKLKQNKRGSGIVTVMVAVMFLATFGSMLLMTSLTDFEMKASDRRGKQVFYNAEVTLNEIKTGIENVVSDSWDSSLKVAYININQASAQQNFAIGFEKIVKEWYVTEIQTNGEQKKWPILPTGSAPERNNMILTSENGSLIGRARGEYDVTKLAYIIDPDENCEVYFNIYGTEEIADVNGIHFNVSDDENLKPVVIFEYKLDDAISEPTEEQKNNKNNYILSSILFKNINVTTISDGIKNTVSTDLRIDVPDIGFSSSGSYTKGVRDMPKYSLVVGKKFVQKGVNNNLVRVLGNAYFGGIDIWDDSKLEFGNEVSSDDDYAGNYQITVKDDIEVHGIGYSDTDLNYAKQNQYRIKFFPNTRLYANGIKILNKCLAVFYGKQTNIYNDLDLKGQGAYAALGGDYYGFGTGEESNHSSSIISNGIKTRLDLDGEEMNLVLCGVSFVKYSSVSTSPDQPMGESITVKENQRIYLVRPSDIMQVTVGADNKKTTSNTIIKSNPFCFDTLDDVIPVYDSEASGDFESDTNGLIFRPSSGWNVYENGEPVTDTDNNPVTWSYADYNAEIKPIIVPMYHTDADGSEVPGPYFVYYALIFNDDNAVEIGESSRNKKEARHRYPLTAQENRNLFFSDYAQNNEEYITENVQKYVTVTDNTSKIGYKGLGNWAKVHEVRMGDKVIHNLEPMPNNSYNSVVSSSNIRAIQRKSEDYSAIKKWIVEAESTADFTGEYQLINNEYVPKTDNPNSESEYWSPYYYWIKYNTVSEITNFDDSSAKIKEFYEKDESGAYKDSVGAIVAVGDFTYNYTDKPNYKDENGKPTVHIIVCNGNLTISSDFDGIVFCQGNLIIDESCGNKTVILRSNAAEVKTGFNSYSKIDDTPLEKYFHISLGKAESDVDINGGLHDVYFENWRKY